MAKRRARKTKRKTSRAPKKTALPSYTIKQTAFVIVVGAVVLTVVLGSDTSFYNLGRDAGAGYLFRATPTNTSIGPPPMTCKDTDGVDLEVKGSCTWSGGVHEDYCWDDYSVVEFSCGGLKCIQNIFSCLNYGYTSCQNGACINTTILPDLTVISLGFTGGGCGGSSGGNATCNVSMEAVVKNIGNATADASFTELEVIGYDWSYVSTPLLVSGQQTTVLDYFTLSPGNYTLFALADAHYQVTESNEDNNNLTVSGSV